jgi:hypothetical protein
MEPIIRAKYAFALQERKLSSLGKKRMNKQNIMRNVSEIECEVFPQSCHVFWRDVQRLDNRAAYCGCTQTNDFPRS